MLIFYGPCDRWCLVAGWSNKRRRRRKYSLWGETTSTTVGLYRGSQRDVVCFCWPIAHWYKSPNAGGGGVAGSQPMSTAVHITWYGAQINLGDLPPCLTYGFVRRRPGSMVSCMQVFVPLPMISLLTLPLSPFIYLSGCTSHCPPPFSTVWPCSNL